MHWKKPCLFFGLMLQIVSISCSKIDTFDKPYMLEGFTGVVKVTPGIEGITANTYSPGLIFFNSNKDGTEVIMYGPSTSNFSLYSILPDSSETKDLFRDKMHEDFGISKMDKLDFSGFRARVDSTNGKKITVYAFGDQSEGMSKFKWDVEGYGLIDGPDSHVLIKISTKVGILKKMLPNEILESLAAPESDVSLAEFEDEEAIVYLAQIEVLGEALTLVY